MRHYSEDGTAQGYFVAQLYGADGPTPPCVVITASARGAGSDHRLLLHWGMSDRIGGGWLSPVTNLAELPPGGREPDKMSYENHLSGAVAGDAEQSMVLPLPPAHGSGLPGAIVLLVGIVPDKSSFFKKKR